MFICFMSKQQNMRDPVNVYGNDYNWKSNVSRTKSHYGPFQDEQHNFRAVCMTLTKIYNVAFLQKYMFFYKQRFFFNSPSVLLNFFMN